MNHILHEQFWSLYILVSPYSTHDTVQGADQDSTTRQVFALFNSPLLSPSIMPQKRVQSWNATHWVLRQKSQRSVLLRWSVSFFSPISEIPLFSSIFPLNITNSVLVLFTRCKGLKPGILLSFSFLGVTKKYIDGHYNFYLFSWNRGQLESAAKSRRDYRTQVKPTRFHNFYSHRFSFTGTSSWHFGPF